uniref:Large ribosomal subunit protein bL21c n=1 Tax=Lomariopsis japurensis TaxID=373558 RepID=A0A5B9RC96_9MONI|nr:ribosomal protein L21 [Lomariopsis japurensis]QEG57484.1 ribosomal protein L21 [Lomariopsis japurensis]
MNKYAIIDIGGKQLRVEPGRFHDTQHFTPFQHVLTSNKKISINRVLLICHGSSINLGYPWLDDATVKGRILHGCFKKRLTVQQIYSKKRTRRTFGYRENMTRFIVDSIYFGHKDL